jgi:hypothetical protein
MADVHPLLFSRDTFSAMFAETAVTQRRERERKGKKNDDRTDK